MLHPPDLVSQSGNSIRPAELRSGTARAAIQSWQTSGGLTYEDLAKLMPEIYNPHLVLYCYCVINIYLCLDNNNVGFGA